MEIMKIKTDKFSIYSLGEEKEYTGKTIIYKENTYVFVIYYYVYERRFYILKDDKNGIEMPYINGRIKIIGKIDLFNKRFAVSKINRTYQHFKNALFNMKEIDYIKYLLYLENQRLKYKDIYNFLQKAVI